MANVFTNFLEQMSGTSKQKYGTDLYDAKEAKKYKDRRDGQYDEYGKRDIKFGKKSDEFFNRADASYKEGDRYRGLTEKSLSKGEESIGKTNNAFQRGQADINEGRSYRREANELMNDRSHYDMLAQRSKERYDSFSNARLEAQSLRNKMSGPVKDSGFTTKLLDAFQASNKFQRTEMENRVGTLGKTNPVAAAKMRQDFEDSALKSVGSIKQNAGATESQLQQSSLTREAQMLMGEQSLLNMQAREDQQSMSTREGRIQNQFAGANASLNSASAEGNIASGYLNQAAAYGDQGRQYQSLAGQVDNRGNNFLNSGVAYQGMSNNMLDNQTSLNNFALNQQEKYRLNDTNARSRVDSFNNSRANMGFQNVMRVGELGAKITGAATGADAYGVAIAGLGAYESNQNLEKSRVNVKDGSYVDRNPNYQEPVTPAVSSTILNNDPTHQNRPDQRYLQRNTGYRLN
jgi:hypothetical protein